MNNQERTIAILLGLTLVGWMFYSNKQADQRAREASLNAPPPASETTDPDAVLPPTQTALAATSETPLQPEAEAAAVLVETVVPRLGIVDEAGRRLGVP